MRWPVFCLGASPRVRVEAGSTVMEIVVVLGLIATLTGMAIPQLLASVDDYRALAAVRYFSTRLQQTRMEAVARSADVGMRFVQTNGSYTYTTFLDGNGNGIRALDIARSIDVQIAPSERLRDQMSGVDFGVASDLPPVDAGSPAPGGDPIKLGASNILTFSSLGSSSTGSLYIRSRGGVQYVIRVFGDTGKTRILKFHARSRRWLPL